MKNNPETAQNRSDHVKREATTGRLTNSKAPKGDVRASAISRTVVKQASSKRGAALQRLANR